MSSPLYTQPTDGADRRALLVPVLTTLALVALLLGGTAARPALAEQPTAAEAVENRNDAGELPDPEPQAFNVEIDVRERASDLVGIAVSASEGSTGTLDLEQRPILRPGDIVETVPGTVATQHSGGGKANQYFLRGFNLDHGTDFAVSVGGVPVNMPTHGHGQGYADLNFLIPELVERARFRKGPYWADVGDFSTAGSLDIDLVRSLPHQLLSLTGGSNDYGRVVFADSIEAGTGDLLLAVESFHDNGPWTRGDDFDGSKGVLRYSVGDAVRGWSLTAMGYDADWLATDQIPQRTVESGALGRFDSVSHGSRGSTQRLSLGAEVHRAGNRTFDSISAYLLSYDFDLVSNFTYLLDDPISGDEFGQVDDRWVLGLETRRSWLGSLFGRRSETSAGVQLRFDHIDNGLLDTNGSTPFSALSTGSAPTGSAGPRSIRRDRIEQWTGGVYVETRVRATDWLRLSGGLRLQGLEASVSSDLTANSGSTGDLLLSPKLSLAFGPWKRTELYLNMGYGLHSNDARGAVIAVDPASGEGAVAVDPLVRTVGADIGVRTALLPGLQSALTLFGFELDSELLFIGDLGTTEAGRPSRRAGIEWSNHYLVSDALSLELDVTLADAEFRDREPAGTEIPGSVGRTIAAAIGWSDSGPWHGSLRWRYFGDVPLIEDGSVVWSSSSTLNGRIGHRFARGLSVVLEGFNLLDRKGSDIEYFYASRLPGEPPQGIEDRHFHPLPRRSLRLTLSWRH